MEGGTQVNSKQYTCHFLAQQRSGTQFVGLELPVSWGCQDGSKESSKKRGILDDHNCTHTIRTPSSKIITMENGRITATKYKRPKKKSIRGLLTSYCN